MGTQKRSVEKIVSGGQKIGLHLKKMQTTLMEEEQTSSEGEFKESFREYTHEHHKTPEKGYRCIKRREVQLRSAPMCVQSGKKTGQNRAGSKESGTGSSSKRKKQQRQYDESE